MLVSEAKRLVDDRKLIGYVECSPLTGENVKAAFDMALEASFGPTKDLKDDKRGTIFGARRQSTGEALEKEREQGKKGKCNIF